MTLNQQTELLRLLAARLERLSADSRWARRASGLRGNIIKILEEVDKGETDVGRRLELLTDAAFDILRQAGQEIPDPEDLSRNGKT